MAPAVWAVEDGVGVVDQQDRSGASKEQCSIGGVGQTDGAVGIGLP